MTVDRWTGCSETSDECGLHNLQCDYPNCHKGKRDAAKRVKNLVKTVTLPALPDDMEYVARKKSDPDDKYPEYDFYGR